MVKQGRKHRNGSTILVWIMVLLVLAALLVMLNSSVMNVRKITVIGNSRFSADEIIASSGITYSTNILKVDEAAAKKGVENNSYLEVQDISRTFPCGVKIYVREREAAAQLSTTNGFYVLDKDCNVLGLNSAFDNQLPLITGMDITEPTLGKLVTATDNAKITALSSVLVAIKSCGLNGRVQSVDMTSISTVSLTIDINLIVKIGKASTAMEKLSMLEPVTKELGEKVVNGGTLDFSNNDRYIFSAKETPAA